MSSKKVFNRNVSIQFKKGLKTNLNTLNTRNEAVEGEPHYATDTEQLYVYDGSGKMVGLSIATAILNNDEIISHNDNIVYN